MHKGIRISAAAAGLTMLIGASGVPTAEAADRLAERAGAQLPASISGLRLAEPLTIQADRSVIDPALVNGDGRSRSSFDSVRHRLQNTSSNRRVMGRHTSNGSSASSRHSSKRAGKIGTGREETGRCAGSPQCRRDGGRRCSDRRTREGSGRLSHLESQRLRTGPVRDRALHRCGSCAGCWRRR
jgi:hypothetical protein